MRDWDKLKTRYLRDNVPVRLGGIAANLARVRSFSTNQEQDKFVEMMIDESKHFIEWTTLDADPEIQSDLVDLQIQLAIWKQNWSLIWSDLGRRAAVADIAGKWSDRVLDWSGLLNET
jgi:hypothetical protein